MAITFVPFEEPFLTFQQAKKLAPSLTSSTPAIQYRGDGGYTYSVGGAAVTLNIPAGTQVGDLLIMAVNIVDSVNTSTIATPSGWTPFPTVPNVLTGLDGQGYYNNYYLFYKYATSGDISTGHFTVAGTGSTFLGLDGDIRGYYNTASSNPINSVSYIATNSSGSQTIPALSESFITGEWDVCFTVSSDTAHGLSSYGSFTTTNLWFAPSPYYTLPAFLDYIPSGVPGTQAMVWSAVASANDAVSVQFTIKPISAFVGSTIPPWDRSRVERATDIASSWYSDPLAPQPVPKFVPVKASVIIPQGMGLQEQIVPGLWASVEPVAFQPIQQGLRLPATISNVSVNNPVPPSNATKYGISSQLWAAVDPVPFQPLQQGRTLPAAVANVPVNNPPSPGPSFAYDAIAQRVSFDDTSPPTQARLLVAAVLSKPPGVPYVARSLPALPDDWITQQPRKLDAALNTLIPKQPTPFARSFWAAPFEEIIPQQTRNFSATTIPLPSINLIQSHFRVRVDSNQADGAGNWNWAAALDTSASVPILTPFRIRFSVSNTGFLTSTSNPYNLYVSRNGGAYTAISTTSAFVFATDATGGNSANTQTITVPLLGGNGTFQANGVYSDTGPTPALTISNGDFVEFEFGLQFTSAVGPSDTYNFQVYQNGSPLNSYQATPQVTSVPTGSITYLGRTFSYSASPSVVATIPSAVVNGNVMVMIVDASDHVTDGSVFVPSGWNQIIHSPWSSDSWNSTFSSLYAFWRAANSEPASYTVNASSSSGIMTLAAFIYAFSNVSTTAPINGSNSVAGTGFLQTFSLPTLLETLKSGEMYFAASANNQGNADPQQAGTNWLDILNYIGVGYANGFYMPQSAVGSYTWDYGAGNSASAFTAVGFTLTPSGAQPNQLDAVTPPTSLYDTWQAPQPVKLSGAIETPIPPQPQAFTRQLPAPPFEDTVPQQARQLTAAVTTLIPTPPVTFSRAFWGAPFEDWIPPQPRQVVAAVSAASMATSAPYYHPFLSAPFDDWQAPPKPRQLPPSFLNVPVNNPPRKGIRTVPIDDSVAPQQPRQLVAAITSSTVPYARPFLPVFSDDWQAQPQRHLNAGLLNVPVNNPPTISRAAAPAEELWIPAQARSLFGALASPVVARVPYRFMGLTQPDADVIPQQPRQLTAAIVPTQVPYKVITTIVYDDPPLPVQPRQLLAAVYNPKQVNSPPLPRRNIYPVTFDDPPPPAQPQKVVVTVGKVAQAPYIRPSPVLYDDTPPQQPRQLVAAVLAKTDVPPRFISIGAGTSGMVYHIGDPLQPQPKQYVAALSYSVIIANVAVRDSLLYKVTVSDSL